MAGRLSPSLSLAKGGKAAQQCSLPIFRVARLVVCRVSSFTRCLPSTVSWGCCFQFFLAMHLALCLLTLFSQQFAASPIFRVACGYTHTHTRFFALKLRRNPHETESLCSATATRTVFVALEFGTHSCKGRSSGQLLFCSFVRNKKQRKRK